MLVERGIVMKIVLIIVYLLATTSGLVLMKLGGNTGTFLYKSGDISFSVNVISALGFVCYIISFLLFTKIITMFELGFIYPLSAGVVQILTLLASYFILKEKFSTLSIVGCIFVIIGIVIMNIKH